MSSEIQTSVKKIAVVGFGLMGAQISQVLAQAGYTVCACDVNDEALKRGLEIIQNGRYGFVNSVATSRLSEAQAKDALGRIRTSSSIEESAKDADLVLEAAIEEIGTKREIMRKVSSVSNGVLASNTSTLSISKIAEPFQSQVRRRILGMHFFNPPQVMKLVEVVRTGETDPSAVSLVEQVALSLGKTPIGVFDIPGFVANRIGLSVFAEASSLLQKKVATVRDIDLAMRLGYGYPMGPFELGDLVGLDARLRNMEALYSETRDERFRPPEILKKLVSEGFLGDPKTKKGSRGGYYEYFELERPSEERRKQS